MTQPHWPGQSDHALDGRRVQAARQHLGDDMSIMVDTNDREGHAALAAQLDTPIATGEILTSLAAHSELIGHRATEVGKHP